MTWYKVLGYEPTKDGNDREYIHVTNSYPTAVDLADCWRNLWGYSPVFIEETSLETEVK